MTIEVPYEMANLFPKHTGLPFVVWISVRGSRSRHDGVRVKVSTDPKAKPGNLATVSIRPSAEIVVLRPEGWVGPRDWELLQEWIELNRETLIAYWESEIDTQDAIAALVKL
jgi:hypothetical protein